MKITQQAMIEAALFASREPVTVQMLAEMLEERTQTVLQIIEQLKATYQTQERGVQIVEIDGGFQVCTKPEAYPYLAKLRGVKKEPVLSEVMLEVLSIIAYKQPVTKAEIYAIRGVNSDRAINRLIEYGLIEEAGRQETPGRPILLKTTKEFLRHFGICDLKELPELPKM